MAPFPLRRSRYQRLAWRAGLRHADACLSVQAFSYRREKRDDGLWSAARDCSNLAILYRNNPDLSIIVGQNFKPETVPDRELGVVRLLAECSWRSPLWFIRAETAAALPIGGARTERSQGHEVRRGRFLESFGSLPYSRPYGLPRSDRHSPRNWFGKPSAHHRRRGAFVPCLG